MELPVLSILFAVLVCIFESSAPVQACGGQELLACMTPMQTAMTADTTIMKDPERICPVLQQAVTCLTGLNDRCPDLGSQIGQQLPTLQGQVSSICGDSASGGSADGGAATECTAQSLNACHKDVVVTDGSDPDCDMAVPKAKMCLEAMKPNCEGQLKTNIESVLMNVNSLCPGGSGGGCLSFMTCMQPLQSLMNGGEGEPDTAKIKAMCGQITTALNCMKTAEKNCEDANIKEQIKKALMKADKYTATCGGGEEGCGLTETMKCVTPVQHLVMSDDEPDEKTIKDNCGSLGKAMNCVLKSISSCKNKDTRAMMEEQLKNVTAMKSKLEEHCGYTVKDDDGNGATSMMSVLPLLFVSILLVWGLGGERFRN